MPTDKKTKRVPAAKNSDANVATIISFNRLLSDFLYVI